MKLPSSFEELHNLVARARKADSNEFLQLIKTCTQLLVSETDRIGDLQISGRLAEVAPVGEAIVVGDIHGDLESLTHILGHSNLVEKAKAGKDISLIFLGDYGDRGPASPEVYYVVLKLKELFPDHVLLMRGNHEGPNDLMASPHDLPIHLNRRYGKKGSKVYLKLRELFNHLLNAVLIKERYILLHGGAPSQASKIDDIAYAHKKHPREFHLEEILWSDPWEGIKGTYTSPRGAGRLFGENITDRLLEISGAKTLIRGHEPSEEGFKTNHSGKVLTIFSRRGPPYFNEYGAYLHLDMSRKVEKTKQLLQNIRRF